MHLFKICASQSNLKQFKSFKEIPKDCLFDKFVNFNKTSIFLLKKKKKIRWYNENSRKIKKDFAFRFWGNESLIYLKNFPRFIQIFLTFVILCENIRF